jgi:hypothetical protein
VPLKRIVPNSAVEIVLWFHMELKVCVPMHRLVVGAKAEAPNSCVMSSNISDNTVMSSDCVLRGIVL